MFIVNNATTRTPSRTEKQWYTINAKKSAESTEILIYEEIGESWWSGEGIGAKKFVEDLRDIKTPSINVRINSPGGNVFDGFAIYNALLRHAAKITVDIDGIAASIASVIALSGDQIRMAKNALFMIHDPSGGVLGTAEDMRSMAVTLDKIRDGIAGVYNERTKKPLSELRTLMSAESWYTADEAKDAGFVHEITATQNITNSFDLTKFKRAPQGAFLQPVTNRPALDDSERRAQLARAELRVLRLRRR